MNDDMTKRRDELAKVYSAGIECICDRPDEGFCWYHLSDEEKVEQSYKSGFDAGVAEMQAQNDSLKAQIEVIYKEQIVLSNSEHCLLEQCDKLTQERDALKAQLEIAFDALSYCANQVVWVDQNNQKVILTYGYCVETTQKALEQIQKMRGGN